MFASVAPRFDRASPKAAFTPKLTISARKPNRPKDGDLWWKSDEGVLKIRYYDGSSRQWVDAVPMIPGPTGPTGPDVGMFQTYDSSSTADSDPGNGKFKADNTTFASITKLFVDNLDYYGTDISAWFDTFDDSTNTVRGSLRIQEAGNPQVYWIFNVTGSVVNGTGYRKISVTPIVSGGSFTSTNRYGFSFYRAGDVGPTGATGPTGPAGTFVDAGTKMIAVQTSAPTGWTKDATHNDKALRLVTGTAGTGGSTPFTTAFASYTPAGTISSDSISTAQLASHAHTISLFSGPNSPFNNGKVQESSPASPNSTPGSDNPAGSGSTHTHTYTGTAFNFAVNYVDCIIITKS